jgi:hypothetical protein
MLLVVFQTLVVFRTLFGLQTLKAVMFLLKTLLLSKESTPTWHACACRTRRAENDAVLTTQEPKM